MSGAENPPGPRLGVGRGAPLFEDTVVMERVRAFLWGPGALTIGWVLVTFARVPSMGGTMGEGAMMGGPMPARERSTIVRSSTSLMTIAASIVVLVLGGVLGYLAVRALRGGAGRTETDEAADERVGPPSTAEGSVPISEASSTRGHRLEFERQAERTGPDRPRRVERP